MSIANTPDKEYFAVIFTSILNEDIEGYAEMAKKMVDLAKEQPGYLGIESARNEIGITVSYWESEEAIKNWKDNVDHLVAQKFGKEKWYKSYALRVCKMHRQYFFNLKK